MMFFPGVLETWCQGFCLTNELTQIPEVSLMLKATTGCKLANISAKLLVLMEDEPLL